MFIWARNRIGSSIDAVSRPTGRGVPHLGLRRKRIRGEKFRLREGGFGNFGADRVEMGVECRRFKRWESKCKVVECLAFLWIETVLFEMLQGKGKCGFVRWGNLDVSKELRIETS